MSDGQRKAIDTDIFDVTLRLKFGNFNLNTRDIYECYFVEDIYCFSLIGKLVFLDRGNILEDGPITGNEEIVITYGEYDNKSISFNMYKIGKVNQLLQRNRGEGNIVEIYFCDQMYNALTKFQYSKSWKDTKISDIVKNISEHMLGIKEWKTFEDTNEKIPYFVMPYWKPCEALVWLMKRASSSVTNTPGYLFYNSTDGIDKGKFTNFCSIETLLRNTKLETGDDGKSLRYTFSDSNKWYINKILSWDISGVDSTSLNILAGGKRLGYDSRTKEFVEKNFKYEDIVSKFTSLGRKSLFTKISTDHTIFKNEAESDPTLLENIYIDDFIKRYLVQNVVKIVVRGYERRYAGMMIDLEWPSADKTEIYNKTRQGKYLVKSITHSFGGGNNPPYLQKMVLSKNGYDDSDLTELVKPGNTNTGTEFIFGRK